jgi:hypothetical protein
MQGWKVSQPEKTSRYKSNSLVSPLSATSWSYKTIIRARLKKTHKNDGLTLVFQWFWGTLSVPFPPRTSPTMANYHGCGLVGDNMMATNGTSVRQRTDSFLDIMGRLLPSFVALERQCNLF